MRQQAAITERLGLLWRRVVTRSAGVAAPPTSRTLESFKNTEGARIDGVTDLEA